MHSSLGLNRFLRTAMQPSIIRTALKVSLVIGSILNIINQGHHLFTDTAVSWPRFFMNYLVPFCVSAYSAAKNERGRRSKNESIGD